MKTKKLKQITTIVFYGLLIFLAVNIRNQKNDAKHENEIIRKNLNELLKTDKQTKEEIISINKKIKTNTENDIKTKLAIKTATRSYQHILKQVKQLNDEKSKTDHEINSYSDSSDRSWFNSRFPRFDDHK